MDEPIFTIGAIATCSDGECGEVNRVVIDPIDRSLTHLIIEPSHRQGLGRLVPIDLVASSNGEVVLHCSLQEFEQLSLAEETDFLPGTIPFEGYAAGDVMPLPYFALGPGNTSPPVTYEKLPLGEVAIRRDVSVHATDGEIGKVQGVVIDSSDHHVTHVLLQEGHLWGRREVAIPVGAVSDFGSEIRLSIAKSEVQELPPVDLLGSD